MGVELLIFDNHLLNGLLFCKKVYDLFVKIRNGPDGEKRIRLREGKVEKKLIEELIPIARYIQSRYNPERQYKVRWVDGSQHFDAELIVSGRLIEKQALPKRQFIEVTTAVYKNDHYMRQLMDQKKKVFGVKSIEVHKSPKKIESLPYVYTDNEAEKDLSIEILKRIDRKTNIQYPKDTVLVIQCIPLRKPLLEDEWTYVSDSITQKFKQHSFHDIYLFDDNYKYSTTIY